MESVEQLFDVKSEETLREGAFMWIDRVHSSALLQPIIGSLVLLFLTMATGLTGPETISVLRTHKRLGDNPPQSFYFNAAPISGYNRFLAYELSFDRPISSDAQPITFFYRVDILSRSLRANRTETVIADLSLPNADINRTERVPLFRDKILTYEAAQLFLDVRTPGGGAYKGLTIYTFLGAHDHTSFQGYFRLLYSILEFCSLLAFGYQFLTRKQPIPTEQKIAAVLLLSAICSNNPFYLCHAYKPQPFYLYWDLYMTPLFHSVLMVCCLLMFDLIADSKSFRSWASSGLPLSFGALSFCAEYLIISYSFGQTFSRNELISDPNLKIVEIAQLSVNVVFIVWACVKIFRIVTYQDITEKNRCMMYVFFGLFVVSRAGVVVARYWTDWMWASEVEWIATFALSNLFVMMMVYLHWPYETNEQSYVIGTTVPLKEGGLDVDEAASSSDGGFAAAEEAEDKP
jgi:hypothetical protein